MSAVLSTEDLQPVADLIERVQNVQRAIRDLHEAYDGGRDGDEFRVAITQRMIVGAKDTAVAHTHGISYWVLLQGLAAMERELLKQLQAKEITVESVLPIRDGA